MTSNCQLMLFIPNGIAIDEDDNIYITDMQAILSREIKQGW